MAQSMYGSVGQIDCGEMMQEADYSEKRNGCVITRLASSLFSLKICIASKITL